MDQEVVMRGEPMARTVIRTTHDNVTGVIAVSQRVIPDSDSRIRFGIAVEALAECFMDQILPRIEGEDYAIRYSPGAEGSSSRFNFSLPIGGDQSLEIELSCNAPFKLVAAEFEDFVLTHIGPAFSDIAQIYSLSRKIGSSQMLAGNRIWAADQVDAIRALHGIPEPATQ